MRDARRLTDEDVHLVLGDEPLLPTRGVEEDQKLIHEVGREPHDGSFRNDVVHYADPPVGGATRGAHPLFPRQGKAENEPPQDGDVKLLVRLLCRADHGDCRIIYIQL